MSEHNHPDTERCGAKCGMYAEAMGVAPAMGARTWDDIDAQRRTMNEIDDYLYDEVKGARGIALSTEEMDEIIEKTMQLARHRMAG